MLKRPLNTRFGPRVLAGIKRTTIRDTAWPLNKPIMLYHWSGKPYASPQQDVAVVQVHQTKPITITYAADGMMSYSTTLPLPHPLWFCEGFDSQDDMDAWFLAKIKPGQTVHKHLMLFDLLPPET